MNKIYRDLMVGQAKKAVSAARSVQHIDHSGLKGQLREIVVRDLLRPLLPYDFIVGTGQVVSAYGESSNQLDVVVCDRKVVPPILFEGSSGIFPLEATLLTVEVKRTLDAGELRTSQESAAKLALFHHAPPVGSPQHDAQHRIEHVIPYVLAFASDLDVGGKSETKRYDEIRRGAPAVKGLCVVERGFWFWDTDK